MTVDDLPHLSPLDDDLLASSRRDDELGEHAPALFVVVAPREVPKNV